MERPNYAIAIHAGAAETWIGESTSEESTTRFLNSLLQGAEESLAAGASAVAVATDVVAALEDYPEFNAGKGASLNIDGFHELEAAVVDGTTSEYRAVAGLQRTKNPVRLASTLLSKPVPAFLVGKAADKLAKPMGVEVVANSYFTTKKRQQYWQSHVHQARLLAEDHGTAGAVVLDRHGNLAAANTTGGMTFKLSGRIGDTAVLGAGIWADKQVAIVCGTGEAILKSTVAGKIAAEFSRGGMLNEAVRNAILSSAEQFPRSSCGVIALSSEGMLCVQNNSRLFVAAAITSSPSTPRIMGVLPSSFPILNQHVIYRDGMTKAGLAKYPVMANQVALELRPGVRLLCLEMAPFLVFFRTLYRIVGALSDHLGAVRCGFIMGGDSPGFIFPVGCSKSCPPSEREQRDASTEAWRVCPDGGESQEAPDSPDSSVPPSNRALQNTNFSEVHRTTTLNEGYVLETSFQLLSRKVLSEGRVLGRTPGHQHLFHLPLPEYLGFMAATWKALRTVSDEYGIPLSSLRLEVEPDSPRGAEVKIKPPSLTPEHFPRSVPYCEDYPGFMTTESGAMAKDLEMFTPLAAQLHTRLSRRRDRVASDVSANRPNADGCGPYGRPLEVFAILYDACFHEAISFLRARSLKFSPELGVRSATKLSERSISPLHLMDQYQGHPGIFSVSTGSKPTEPARLPSDTVLSFLLPGTLPKGKQFAERFVTHLARALRQKASSTKQAEWHGDTSMTGVNIREWESPEVSVSRIIECLEHIPQEGTVDSWEREQQSVMMNQCVELEMNVGTFLDWFLRPEVDTTSESL